MRQIILLSIFLMTIGVARPQNSLFLSHQMLLPASYNPAAVGIERQANLAFVYRNQWTGYSPTTNRGGSPNTQFLSFNIPTEGLPISGVGVNLSNDNLGPENNFQIHFLASKEIRLRFASLYIGVSPGLYNKTLNGNELEFNDPTDPLNSGTTQTELKPDLGVGLWYSSNQGYYLSLSSLNVLEPDFEFGYGKLKRSYTAGAGVKRQLSENMLLVPNFNLRTDLSDLTFDVGTMLYYRTSMWGGLYYRLEESAMLFLGYGLLNNQLHVGYAFEYILYSNKAKSTTTHEIIVKYSLPELVFGGRKSVKTPRFSY